MSRSAEAPAPMPVPDPEPGTGSGAARLFDEEALRAVLQRAWELQAEERKTDAALPGPRDGFSAADLERIGAELGLDPRHIRGALAEHAAAESPPGRRRLWGVSRSVELERMVEGDASVPAWDDMVEEARRCFGETGVTGSTGSSLEWTSRRGGARVVVKPSGGRVRVRLAWHDRVSAVPFVLLPSYFAVIASTMAMAALELPNGVEAGIIASAIVGAAAAGRVWYGSWAQRQAARFHVLMGRLEALAAQPPATESPSRAAQ